MLTQTPWVLSAPLGAMLLGLRGESCAVVSLPVGGSESLRSYWKMYLPKVLLLIYVVDSADHARLPVAKQLLHQLIQNNSTLPVVVLANKQVRVPCC